MTDDEHRYPARLVVLRNESLTRHLRRIVLGGPGFDLYAGRHNAFTDRYVKLVFLNPHFSYTELLDLVDIKASMPAEAQPVLRTYTLRWVDLEAREVAIDFVLHGDEGYAGPWAQGAVPGDVVHLRGPGGAYAPDPAVDAHLLAGDEAGLPAIAAAIEALPADAAASVFIEVESAEDEIRFDAGPNVTITWLHREGRPAGSTTLLADAVKAMDWPVGRVQTFVHGEAGLMKALRRFLLAERGVDRADLSISGYWRAGNNEESFRVWKSQQQPV